MDNINKIYLGDCLELMPKHVEDKSIDMIFCDLPYGTTACKWDSIIDLPRLWGEYERVIKDNGAIVLFASQPFTSKLISSNFNLFKYEWVWEKSKASNFLQAKYMPLKAHENILVFGKGKVNYYPQKTQGKPFNKGNRKNDGGIATEVYNRIPNAGMEIKNESGLRNPRTVQYFKTAEREGKLHPTQKPLDLIEYMIKTYTNEGDLILDNACGSGTTGRGAKNLKRNYIMMEKDPTYFKLAKERLND